MASLETDLNTTPYYDDFDETKNFHRVLFRPATPVQARELTQLQTILQNQIERFGDNIYKEGTIIKGVTFSYDNSYQYIKLKDLREDGQPLNVATYSGYYIKSSANLISKVVNVASGLESQNPNLNTFYVKYLNTGTADEKTYANAELLTLYTTFDNAKYSNNSVVQIRVANSSFTAPVGSGYAFSVSDGIIFQKGNFVRVSPQTVVVSAYSQTPNNVSVGFVTQETIVNSSADGTLLDNAAGFENENAPGADRLKLTPTLVTVNTDSTNSSFFTLARWDNGKVTRQNQSTVFNSINQELAKRTAEESGDYIVKPFGFASKPANTSHVNIVMGSGIAYIKGNRIEQTDNISIATRKGTDTAVKENQIISQTYGNYVIVDEWVGNFDFESGSDISLRDTAANNVSDESFGLTAAGVEIGTAKVLAVTYHSGIQGTPQAQYKVYLANVTMNSGSSFESVRSIFFNGTNKGVADLVLEQNSQSANVAVLKETSNTSLVYEFAQPAIKRLTDAGGTNSTQFIFRTSDETLNFNTSGSLTIDAGSDVFPYTTGGTLSDTQERDIMVIARASIPAVNATGNVAVSASNTITGDGTTFITDFDIGDWVLVANSTASESSLVTAITNNTSMSIQSAITGPFSADKIAKYYPSGTVIPITGKDSANVTIDGTGSIMTINMGETLTANLNVIAYYNVQRNAAKAIGKDVLKDIYIKVEVTANTVNGPWCLGLPDVYKITGIWKDASTYSESNQSVINHFLLDSGQKERFYGLSHLVKSPVSNLTISAGDKLLVKLNVFKENLTGGGRGFYSIDSYPIDDATSPTPSDKIKTEEIPYYSSKTGKKYRLRNSVDFRMHVANTAAYSNTIAGATDTPANTETFSSSLFIPAPNENFQCDTEYYLGRKDNLSMDTYGNHIIVEGTPDINPVAPSRTDNAMLLAEINIPPYPSLSTYEGKRYNRPEMTVDIEEFEYKRYTMNDINQIENRLNRVEYYTSLSLLETETKDLVIPAADGTNRFKNGIFVDPANNHSLVDVSNPETAIGHDPEVNSFFPIFKQRLIELEVSNTSNTTITTSVATLPYTETEIFSQNTATQSRVVTGGQYEWTGILDCYPSHDIYFDVRYNPTVINNTTVIKNIVEAAEPIEDDVTDNIDYPPQTPVVIKDPIKMPSSPPPVADDTLPAIDANTPAPVQDSNDALTEETPGNPTAIVHTNAIYPIIRYHNWKQFGYISDITTGSIKDRFTRPNYTNKF